MYTYFVVCIFEVRACFPGREHMVKPQQLKQNEVQRNGGL